MLGAFGSIKGSPGVTTIVNGLATTWPAERQLIVAELDPAGGDLAARTGLHDEPGLVTLAAAGRREIEPGDVVAHCQPLPAAGAPAGTHPAGVADRLVLVGPPGADQAMAAMTALRGRLGPTLAGIDDTDVIVDCGRLDTTSPALELLAAADIVVVVTRTALSDVHHLQHRLPGLHRPDTLLLVVGDRPYAPHEVADAVDNPAYADVPHDRRAAEALTGLAPIAPRSLRRTALVRRLSDISRYLVGYEADRSANPSGAPEPTPVTRLTRVSTEAS